MLTLLAIALLVGALIWFFERRENEHYSGGVFRGLVAGAWWSAVAMTQAGAAQQGPRSTPGRVLAVLSMVASVVTIAVFIAGITSALATQRLLGVVRNDNDLRSVNVRGCCWVVHSGVPHGGADRLPPVSDSCGRLARCSSGQIDAFVYDRPLLAWMLQQDFPHLELASVTFDNQNYAFALVPNSPIRVALDVGLLETLRSQWWEETRFRYLGRNATN